MTVAHSVAADHECQGRAERRPTQHAILRPTTPAAEQPLPWQGLLKAGSSRSDRLRLRTRLTFRVEFTP